ncbi:MAG TPA: hypothetical protein VGE26_11935 [Sphingobacteriaceae bacterium]
MESWKRRKFSISLQIFLAALVMPAFGSAQEKSALVPNAAIVQYAGSIGFLSIGAGYDLFRNQRGSIDLMYGYVPKTKGGKLDILSLKFSYRPFTIKIRDIAVVYPLNPGMFFSYTVDRKLSLSWDRDQYGKGYYGWSEALRSHLSFGNEVDISGRKLFGDEKIKAVVLYSEFNASDLYLVSWVLNREALSVSDIFKLGVGVRLKF